MQVTKISILTVLAASVSQYAIIFKLEQGRVCLSSERGLKLREISANLHGDFKEWFIQNYIVFLCPFFFLLLDFNISRKRNNCEWRVLCFSWTLPYIWEIERERTTFLLPAHYVAKW